MKLTRIKSPMPLCEAYLTSSNCQVYVGQEPLGKGGKLEWHMSISHPKRNPTWEEIRDCRYQLIPNEITMAMILPPMEEYVNVHNFCFHLHEIEGEFATP